MEDTTRAAWRPPAHSGRTSPGHPRTTSRCGHRHHQRRVGLIVGASLFLASACSGIPGTGGLDKAGGTVTVAPLDLRMANTRGYEPDAFLERVAELSGGALTLTADRAWGQPTLTNEPDALRAVRDGHVDIAIVPTGSFDAVGVTAFDALMDPMLVDSMPLQLRVLADPVASEMLHRVASAGMVGIGLFPGPIRLPAGITGPLVGPATYAGARIATNPSPVSERALKTLGAVPVEFAFHGADVTGFDGLEQQASSVAADQYDGIVRWMTTNVGLWPRPVAIVAGASTWQRLTNTQRGWLVQAARGALSDTTNRRSDEEDIANMCRRGRIATVSASASQIGELRRAFAPVDRWLRSDSTTARYLDRIEAIKQQLGDTPSGQPMDCAAHAEGPPPPPSSGAGSPSSPATHVPAGPASEIDGDYAMQTTAHELAAAGASPGEVAPGNWGDLRWVFDRGRFASTQFASNPSDGTTCTWSFGTYALHDGPVIELTMLGGGGIVGGGGANKAGEVFDFAFSIYRDTITMSQVTGETSPTPWMVKPWQRQPARPWTGFLETQCLPPVGWDG